MMKATGKGVKVVCAKQGYVLVIKVVIMKFKYKVEKRKRLVRSESETEG